MWFSRFFRSLFGSQSDIEAHAPMPAEEYKGYRITADPMPEGGQYRVQGWIELGDKRERFIRADLLPDRELCAKEVQRKARVLIDQKGEQLFR